MSPELDELAAELDRVLAGLTSALNELREIARGIHPAILAEGGLAAALKTLARRSSIQVELDVRTTARLPERVEVTACIGGTLIVHSRPGEGTRLVVELPLDLGEPA